MLWLLRLLRFFGRWRQRSSVDVDLTRGGTVDAERDFLVQRAQPRDLGLDLSEALLKMFVMLLEGDDMVAGCVRWRSEEDSENQNQTNLSLRETPCCSSGWRPAAPPSAEHSHHGVRLAAVAQPLSSACGSLPCVCWRVIQPFRHPYCRRRQK